MDPFASRPLSLEDFQRKVKAMGEEHHRELPWRYIDDPYAVLVSEVMLQQTQVKRVLDYWPRFMRTFPSIDALASSEVSLVLEMWQGLGYNRRALALRKSAEICSRDYKGNLPATYDELIVLPGIGPATAAGVLSFALQKPSMYLETNVRTVFLHELFPGECDVHDKLIEPLVRRSCPNVDPRSWYYALLDYSAYLKATNPNPSRRSKHHSKQSKFEGSRRQKRAEILRMVLTSEGMAEPQIVRELADFEREHKREAPDESLVEGILSDLLSEGFLRFENGLYSVG